MIRGRDFFQLSDLLAQVDVLQQINGITLEFNLESSKNTGHFLVGIVLNLPLNIRTQGVSFDESILSPFFFWCHNKRIKGMTHHR